MSAEAPTLHGSKLEQAPGSAADVHRLIVHLGFHKTGSTFLQSSLYRSARERAGLMHLLPNGVGVFNAGDLLTRRHSFLQNIRSNNGAVLLEAERDLRRVLKHHDCDLLLSNENLLGDQLGQEESRILYPLAPSVLAFFDRFADARSIEYVFYVRSQADFVESTYLNLVRDGYDGTFDAYLRRIDLPSLDYLAFFNRLAEATTSKIAVIPFELVRVSEATLLETMVDIVGGDVTLSPSPNTRASLSYIGIEIALRSYPMLDPEERRLLSEFLAVHFSIETHERMTLFEASERAEIVDMFRESNAAFFAKWVAPEHRAVLRYYV